MLSVHIESETVCQIQLGMLLDLNCKQIKVTGMDFISHVK